MKKKWPKAATPRQKAATEELLRRLHGKYPGRIISAALFGSVARGRFTHDSDIDVLVVTDKLDANLEWEIWGVGSRVSLEFDVIFNLHVYPSPVWENLRTKRKTIWRNVEREGVELTLQPA